MKQHLWKDNGACFDSDTNLFFDHYEDNDGYIYSPTQPRYDDDVEIHSVIELD